MIKHKVPGHRLGIVNAECEIKGIDGTTFHKETRLLINVHEPNRYKPAMENKEVCMHYYRVKVADVIKQSTELGQKGKYKEARNKLGRLILKL